MSYKNYSEIDLAVINPIRYRGYYYDEIGFYYLQSRYYMPDWSRFINSDLPSIAQEHKDEINGLNLFAYCCNDPVNNSDHTGFSSKGKNTYVFYYYNAESEYPLKTQATNSYYYNNTDKNLKMYDVYNWKDLYTKWNKMKNVKDIFLYLHGKCSKKTGYLSMADKAVKASEILEKMNKIKISGEVYLFSCHGGDGDNSKKISYAFSKLTNAYVYALKVGVSYGKTKTCRYYAKTQRRYYYLPGDKYCWYYFKAKYDSKKKKWKYTEYCLGIRDLTWR